MSSFVVYDSQENSNIPKSGDYSTNNKHANYPPLMSDGRSLIASWQSSSFVENKYKNDNQIATNWQYRKFLTVNAKKIMKEEHENSLTDQGYYTKYPFDEENDKSNPPIFYKSLHENVYPIGRENTDLKTTYLSREQLNSKKITPEIVIK